MVIYWYKSDSTGCVVFGCVQLVDGHEDVADSHDTCPLCIIRYTQTHTHTIHSHDHIYYILVNTSVNTHRALTS